MPATARWEDVRDRWLAVEVSGAGSRTYDRQYKRDAYLALGVAEVWLVDPEARQILVSPGDGSGGRAHGDALEMRTPGGTVVRVNVTGLFAGLPPGGD